ncbi:hypothetical protein [Mycobacterium sp. 141]|uniref:hypothetical protein n=1 Tax=Mycobacterium sp. 141 TaxID=1120797 RepID=UPI00036485FC|nr:hypothetical protein [Mycobacterium sp. 141]
MTGPEDSLATRPISVAELLAKNGTIGAPPVGGRRRRRRGNSDAVTVAELTGEIPIVVERADEPEESPAEQPAETNETKQPTAPDDAEVVSVVPSESDEADGTDATDETDDAEAQSEVPADAVTDAESDYQAHLEARDADPEPVEFKPSTRRPQYQSALRDYRPSGTGAERMSPDFLDETEDDDDSTEDDNRPTYLGSTLGPLFGGQSVAEDVDRRRGPGPEDIDLDDRDEHDEPDDDAEPDETHDLDEHDEHDEDDSGTASGGSTVVRGLWVVGQCIIAVAFGAGLFIAFDQLWKWNTIVALMLGVLVILGLAGGVRVVRKTEDIGSTLTAVAVGALVTFGPLALLQAS